MVKDIAFTAYSAKDVAALRDFYAKNLGFTFTAPYSEDGELMYDEAQVGTGYFSVMTTEWLETAPCGGVAFEVDDLTKTLADLRAKGISVEDPHETPVCVLSSFSDPEGNKVTLHQSTLAK